MNEIARKAVCDLLKTSKRLYQLNTHMTSEPIGGIVDEIDQIVFNLFEITLKAYECPDCFHEAIYSYYTGEIELDELLEYFSELKEALPEDSR
ncbi:hypothetical protein D3C74_159600 [compost metagenome]